jgi:hypothetical protein
MIKREEKKIFGNNNNNKKLLLKVKGRGVCIVDFFSPFSYYFRVECYIFSDGRRPPFSLSWLNSHWWNCCCCCCCCCWELLTNLPFTLLLAGRVSSTGVDVYTIPWAPLSPDAGLRSPAFNKCHKPWIRWMPTYGTDGLLKGCPFTKECLDSNAALSIPYVLKMMDLQLHFG